MNDSEFPRDHFISPSVSRDGVIAVVIVLGLSCSWIGLWGDLHWSLDLLSHFRWQYSIVSAVAVVWTAWRRQRKTLLIAGLTLLLNVGLIGRLAWPPEVSREQVAADFSLRVLSLNVLTSNTNRQAVLDEVLSADADVVFLMEVNDPWVAALQALKTKYPHQITHPRADNFGVALFSRIPWTHEKVLWLGKSEVESVEVHFSHQGREFVFIGTHPLPPVGRVYSMRCNEQFRELAEHVAKLEKPVLVAGDLNATPWSAGMRIVTAGDRLGFRSLSPPWTPTWRAGSIFAIPIDHALCTAPLVITERSVGADVGSDHRPLRLTVGWAK